MRPPSKHLAELEIDFSSPIRHGEDLNSILGEVSTVPSMYREQSPVRTQSYAKPTFTPAQPAFEPVAQTFSAPPQKTFRH